MMLLDLTTEVFMRDSCPQCGSQKIMRDLPLIVDVFTGGGTGGGTADVKIQGAPEAWIFKDTVAAGLTVTICGECGHAELNASNFHALYEAYEKSRAS
jgi:hypothetical protein